MTAEIKDSQAGIVSPVKGKHRPDLGPLAVMVASQSDLDSLSGLMGLKESDSQRLFISRLYRERGAETDGFSIIGPFIGAPYAVMVLETLIAWGVRKIIFFGWCGAVSPKVKVGDIVLPDAAWVDEGTSRHYGMNDNSLTTPSSYLLKKTKEILDDSGHDYQEGAVWSTDAIYRETPEKVVYYQQKGVLAVEMELSALFSVGRYRQVDVAGLLVVSDEVSALRWRPGFGDIEFKKSRKNVNNIIGRLCQSL